MSQTYLITDELSARIKDDALTIRARLKDNVLLEGVAKLRKKIEKDVSTPRHVITEAGIGYRFVMAA
jgi:DNA-binding response OmpR family regulator